MRTSIHPFLDCFVVAFLLWSCSDREPRTLKDVGGQQFPYHFQITALKDAGDSLLIGTDRGIASFNLRNGDFRELRRLDTLKEGYGNIYDIVDTKKGIILYSVQDGGIRQIRSWNDRRAPVLRHPDKGTAYSAYKLFLLPKTEYLIAGTSNGVYRYILTDSLRFEKTLVQLEDAAPMRFFSIEGDNDEYFCSGDKGVFRPEDDTLRSIRGDNVLAHHDAYILCKGGSLLRDVRGTDERNLVVQFKHSPQEFVVDEGADGGASHIYAISASMVEVAEVDTQGDGKDEGRIICTVELEDRNRTGPRSASSRQIGLIKDGYLYVAPGGKFLYKLPLAPYGFSDAVISVCSDRDVHGETLYLLTDRHDLYSMGLSGKVKADRKPRIRYLRSLEKGSKIDLLGVSGKWLIASVDGKPIGLKGYRKKVSRPLEPRGEFAGAGKITCNIWEDGILFQGRDDMVREYRYKTEKSSRMPGLVPIDSVSFPKQPGDVFSLRRPEEPDYYPLKLATLDDILVVGTLHHGTAYKRVSDPDAPFRALLDKEESSRILDIQTFRSVHSPSDTTFLFILDEDHIHRFLFKEGSFEEAGTFALDTINTLYHDTRSNFFNHIHPVKSDKFYLFSSDYDFQRGFDWFCITKEGENGNWKWALSSHIIGNEPSVSFSDAIEAGGRTFLAGSGGIIIPSDGLTDRIAVSTTPFKRIWAKFWPWDAILVILLILALLYRACRDRLKDFVSAEVKMILNRVKKRKTKAQREKIAKDYPNDYVAALFDALVSASRMSNLESNIARFLEEKSAGKNGTDRLAILDQLGHVIKDAKAVVYPDCNFKTKDADKVKAALENLDKIVKDYHVKFDPWDKLIKNDSNRAFFTMDDVTNKTKVQQTEDEGRSAVSIVFYSLYEKLREPMSEKFDSLGSQFFESFTETDVQYKKVFNSLEYFTMKPDPKDRSKTISVPHLTKRSFLLFPLCAKDPVGRFLFSDTFPRKKSDWRRPQKKGESDIHHLPNLAGESEYGGLFGVMARAGLDKIESLSKENKRAREAIQ